MWLSLMRKDEFMNEQGWKNQFTWLFERLEMLDSVFRNRVRNRMRKLDVE